MNRASDRIVGEEPSPRATSPAGMTLCGLADAWAARYPERLAWCDQWGRECWTGRPAARLTWRDVLERSTALAARLARLGLPPGAPVGIFLPNGTDWMLAMLATERAGLTPCLLPISAPAADLAAAIEAAGIEAVVTQAAIGPLRPAELVCSVAAGYFRLRYVLAFGPGVPDGVAELDIETGAGAGGTLPDAWPGRGVVTFERPDGRWSPVPRSSASLVAAAAEIAALVRPEASHTLLTLIAPDDLTALVSGLMLSLISGCALDAHGLFSRGDLDRSIAAATTAHVVAPGWMEPALRTRPADGGRPLLVHDAPVRWPSPDAGDARTIDLLALGQRAVLAAPRDVGLTARLLRTTGEDPSPWLGVAIDPQDGRVHLAGPAAAIGPPNRRGREFDTARSGSGTDFALTTGATPYRVERVGGGIVGVSYLA